MDDVIRGSPDYLPRKLCKDFVRQYRITLTYSQVWNMKERSKERIHGIPQFLYTCCHDYVIAFLKPILGR